MALYVRSFTSGVCFNSRTVFHLFTSCFVFKTANVIAIMTSTETSALRKESLAVFFWAVNGWIYSRRRRGPTSVNFLPRLGLIKPLARDGLTDAISASCYAGQFGRGPAVRKSKFAYLDGSPVSYAASGTCSRSPHPSPGPWHAFLSRISLLVKHLCSKCLILVASSFSVDRRGKPERERG